MMAPTWEKNQRKTWKKIFGDPEEAMWRYLEDQDRDGWLRIISRPYEIAVVRPLDGLVRSEIRGEFDASDKR